MRKILWSVGFLCLLAAGLALPKTVLSGAGEVNGREGPADSVPVQVAPTNNLEVWSATYLGGSNGDSANAVDVAPDGVVLLGGVMPGYNPSGAAVVDLPGGDGVVIRLDNQAQPLSVTRLGGTVNDLEVSPTGQIAACGDFGIKVLNASAATILWSDSPGAGSRCSIGHDGTTAVLVGSSAYVYNSSGTLVGSWSIAGNGRRDIVVDAANASVIAAGYTQVSANLKVAFIRAWAYDGAFKWKSYDFSSAPGLGADTEGYRLAMGRDGLLYFVGTMNGGTGASIFSRDPKDINLSAGSKTVTTDEYDTSYNVGSKTLTWYGRYDPATGDLLQGQTILTRLSSGAGNSIKAHAITADENGRVYLAGEAYATIENRDSRQVAGITVGDYAGGEAFLLVVEPDFEQRTIWTPFTAPGVSAQGSPARGVSVRTGVAAVAITLNNGQLITHNAFQNTPGGLPEAYVATFAQVGGFGPVGAVTISSPPVCFTGSACRLTAAAGPVSATTPISYVWQIGGPFQTNVVDSRTDTVEYTWPTSGAKSVTVEAANRFNGSAVVDNHTVTVIVGKKRYLPVITKN